MVPPSGSARADEADECPVCVKECWWELEPRLGPFPD